MKFFLSEKVAKWEYRSNYGFSALKNVVSTLQTEQERLSVFYDVQPALPQNESIPDFLPGLTNQFINDLLENKVTFDEGLIQLEESIIESFLHYSN